MSEVQVPLCEAGQTLETLPSIEPIEFRSNLRFAHDHAGLGSMVDFSATVDGSAIDHQAIKGKIFARVGWGKSPDGVVLSPSPNQWKPPNVVDRYDIHMVLHLNLLTSIYVSMSIFEYHNRNGDFIKCNF